MASLSGIPYLTKRALHIQNGRRLLKPIDVEAALEIAQGIKLSIIRRCHPNRAIKFDDRFKETFKARSTNEASHPVC